MWCGVIRILPLSVSEGSPNDLNVLLADGKPQLFFNRGHFTSFIKMLNSKSWFYCNDAAVVRADKTK